MIWWAIGLALSMAGCVIISGLLAIRELNKVRRSLSRIESLAEDIAGSLRVKLSPVEMSIKEQVSHK